VKSEKIGMRRALIFVVLFAGFLSVGYASAATTHYVNPGESIQTAVDAASPSDTIIVRDGTYTENVDVNKRLTIQSENGSDSTIVLAANSSDHVFEVTTDYVNLSGFTVKGAIGEYPYDPAGMYLCDACYCNIANTVSKNNTSDGIRLSTSHNNTLANNNLAIGIRTSYNNTITNNNCSNNDVGIWLHESYNNTITSNTCSNNNHNGISLSYTHSNILRNNNCSTNNEGIGLHGSYNNTITNNNCSNNEGGLRLYKSYNNTITNNNCSNNDYGGITLSGDSSNNTIISNTANSNKGCGLVIYGFNNTLRNNTISRSSKYNFHAEGIQDIDTSNKINGKPIRYLVHEKDLIIDSSWDVGYLGIVNSRNITVRDLVMTNNVEGILLDHSWDSKIENVTVLNCETGIDLKSSSNNTITNNNALNNNNNGGIYFQNSSDNFIFNNNLLNNTIGIYFWDYSNNNTLTYNTVNFNSYYGIGFSDALSNNIYLNNFNNSKNVRPSGQTDTSWNSTSKISYTYSSEQYNNYMGNYWSDYNGSDSDNDGIGDTHFNIDSHQDYRPLMLPWENYFASSVFDTDVGTYPSIKGKHTGTIKPSHKIIVNNLYTYPCAGTGGHTETIGLYENGELIANGTWTGYQSDWHNITITPSVILQAGHTYNYTIVTGSYPQVLHAASKEVTGGTITCTSFVDTNGKTYSDWIPAIRIG